jgi:ureidoglycolate amidohydrolase
VDISIDIAKLSSELERLAGFSDSQPPAVSRVMLSNTDIEARKYLVGLFRDAGLGIRVDAAGNIFARWAGRDDLPPVATGSHTDAIPNAGMYDGTTGVLGGLEAIRSLQRSGFKPCRSIELIMFTAEEPTRFGVGCLGSRMLSGAISPGAAANLIDESGHTFRELHSHFAGSGSLDDVRLDAGCYRAFVELHIEQGPTLEQRGLPIGIVTAIAAPASLRATYEGTGGHAGTVMMPDRHDALLPAARLALGVDAAARTLGGGDTVATTGVLDVFPRAVNSIPSRTYLEIDVRDTDLERRDRVLSHIRDLAKQLENEYGQEATVELINADPPAVCDQQIVRAIEDACSAGGHGSLRMVSRAYHDSLFMAQLCPTGMIFIPCRNGVSHRPDEYASPESIATGVQVLARTIARLSES